MQIPLEDYEGHMALPAIGQARMLGDELAIALREHRPRSLCVVGCAGGNGFERLANAAVDRVVGIDINPDYLDIAHRRHAGRIPGLELYVADIQQPLPDCLPVDLVYAALVLEYVDVAAAMQAFRGLCLPNGRLVVILQAPDPALKAVSDSPYPSLQMLGSEMRLRQSAEVVDHARAAGFNLVVSRELKLPSRKSFEVLTFRG